MDDVGIASIRWENANNGISGFGFGVTSFSTNLIPLDIGINHITVWAFDYDGNAGHDHIAIERVPDTGIPTVIITNPTSNETRSTYYPTITLGGTASDNIEIIGVAWTNSLTGGFGLANGRNDWTILDIALEFGDNPITVYGEDETGNIGTDIITVTRLVDTTPPQVNVTSPTINATYQTVQSAKAGALGAGS